MGYGVREKAEGVQLNFFSMLVGKQCMRNLGICSKTLIENRNIRVTICIYMYVCVRIYMYVYMKPFCDLT